MRRKRKADIMGRGRTQEKHANRLGCGDVKSPELGPKNYEVVPQLQWEETPVTMAPEEEAQVSWWTEAWDEGLRGFVPDRGQWSQESVRTLNSPGSWAGGTRQRH